MLFKPLMKSAIFALVFCTSLFTPTAESKAATDTTLAFTGFELKNPDQLLNYQTAVADPESVNPDELINLLVQDIIKEKKKNPKLVIDMDYTEAEFSDDREPAQFFFKWSPKNLIRQVSLRLKQLGIKTEKKQKIVITEEQDATIRKAEPTWFQRNRIPLTISIVRGGTAASFVAYRLVVSGFSPMLTMISALEMFGIYSAVGLAAPLILKITKDERYKFYNWRRTVPLVVPAFVATSVGLLYWTTIGMTIAEINAGIRDLTFYLGGVPPKLNYLEVLKVGLAVSALQAPWDLMVKEFTDRLSAQGMPKAKVMNILYLMVTAASITALTASNLNQLHLYTEGKILMSVLGLADVTFGTYLLREKIVNLWNRAMGKSCSKIAESTDPKD